MVELFVQLEDYLLSLGWTFLNNSSSTVDIKVCLKLYAIYIYIYIILLKHL
jgi:hypothetical protein